MCEAGAGTGGPFHQGPVELPVVASWSDRAAPVERGRQCLAGVSAQERPYRTDVGGFGRPPPCEPPTGATASSVLPATVLVVLTCSTCGAQSPLCDRCLDATFAQLGGVAKVRGHDWGRAVRQVMPGQPWPTFEESERVQAIARRKVEELARGDDRLLDLLARACAAEAREAYEDNTPVPSAVSFTVRSWR